MNLRARDRMLWFQGVPPKCMCCKLTPSAFMNGLMLAIPHAGVNITTVGGVCYKSKHTSLQHACSGCACDAFPPCNGEARRPHQRPSRCGHPVLGIPTLWNQELNKDLFFINYLALWFGPYVLPQGSTW